MGQVKNQLINAQENINDSEYFQYGRQTKHGYLKDESNSNAVFAFICGFAILAIVFYIINTHLQAHNENLRFFNTSINYMKEKIMTKEYWYTYWTVFVIMCIAGIINAVGVYQTHIFFKELETERTYFIAYDIKTEEGNGHGIVEIKDKTIIDLKQIKDLQKLIGKEQSKNYTNPRVTINNIQPFPIK